MLGPPKDAPGEAVGAPRVGSTHRVPGWRQKARRGVGRGISEPPFTVLEKKEPLQAGGQDHQPRPALRTSRDSAIAAGWLCSQVGAAWGGWGERMSRALFVVSPLWAGTFSAL